MFITICFGVKYNLGMFMRFAKILLQMWNAYLSMANTGPSLLESILEEETSKTRKRKPSYFVFTSRSCSGRAFICICCEIMPLFIFSSLQVFVNYATAVKLVVFYDWSDSSPGPYRTNVLPTCASQLERIHVFGGSCWIDNAKTYSAYTQ